jgi:hypothetical protein
MPKIVVNPSPLQIKRLKAETTRKIYAVVGDVHSQLNALSAAIDAQSDLLRSIAGELGLAAGLSEFNAAIADSEQSRAEIQRLRAACDAAETKIKRGGRVNLASVGLTNPT